MDPGDRGEPSPEPRVHLGLPWHSREVEVFLGVAADDVDPQRVVTVEHGLDVEAVVGGTVRRVPREFTEGSLLGGGVGVDHALEHVFGGRRDPQSMRWSADHLEGFTEEPPGDLPLVDVEGNAGRGRQHEQWMGTDDHRHRHWFASCPPGVEESPQVAARMEARPQRGGRRRECPVVAEVAAAGHGVLGDDDTARDVGAEVGGEMGE